MGRARMPGATSEAPPEPPAEMMPATLPWRRSHLAKASAIAVTDAPRSEPNTPWPGYCFQPRDAHRGRAGGSFDTRDRHRLRPAGRQRGIGDEDPHRPLALHGRRCAVAFCRCGMRFDIGRDVAVEPDAEQA